MTKQIVITYADSGYSWYTKRIGEVFDVIEEGWRTYFVEGERYVYKKDCQPYTETLEQAYARSVDAGAKFGEVDTPIETDF